MAASRTARRAPAAPARARPAPRSSPAVASSTARTPRNYDQRTPKKMKAAALRGALSDRARDGRVHVVSSLVDGDDPVDQVGAGRCWTSCRSARHVLVVVERGRPGRVEEPAQRRPGPPARARPAQHLRRAGQRRRRLHRGRARRVPARAGTGKAPRPVATEAEAAASEESSEAEPSEDRRPARHPARAGDLGEELRPARREQVHVHRPPGRQQDRRSRSRSRRSSASRSPASTRSTARASAGAPASGFGKRKDTKRAVVSVADGRPHRHLRRSGLLTGTDD